MHFIILRHLDGIVPYPVLWETGGVLGGQPFVTGEKMRHETRWGIYIFTIFHCLLFGAAFFLCLCSTAKALPSENQFIAGYASAILEREFDGTTVLVLVGVKDGVITIRLENNEKDIDRAELVAALSSIRGRPAFRHHPETGPP